MALKRNADGQAKTLEELKKARKDQTVDFSRMLALDYEEITGGKKSEVLESLCEDEIKNHTPEFFNNNINFWNMQQRLFEAYKTEMEDARQDYVQRAGKLKKTQWRQKIKLLQKALKLVKRYHNTFFPLQLRTFLWLCWLFR